MTWTALVAKELKETLRPTGRPSGVLIASTIVSVVFGIAATLYAGLAAVKGSSLGTQPLEIPFAALAAAGTGLAAAMFITVTIPMNIAIDTIVGERERHTLDTLLAGPLSDAQLLWAKIVSVLITTTLIASAGAAAVMVTNIILFGGWGFVWGVAAFVGGPLIQLVPAFVMTCLVLLMTMRSKTSKDAGQRLGYLLMPIFIGPQALLFFTRDMEPQAALFLYLAAGIVSLIVIIGAPLLLFSRFRRHRLLV